MTIHENICEPDAHYNAAVLFFDLIQPPGDRRRRIELNFDVLEML
jgi:hypothetical protein